jgi:hypothetical protein
MKLKARFEEKMKETPSMADPNPMGRGQSIAMECLKHP